MEGSLVVHSYFSLLILISSILLLFTMYRFYLTIYSGVGYVNITSVFFFKFILIIYIGSIILNIIRLEQAEALGLYQHIDLLLNVWIYSSIAIVLILLGVFVSKKIVNSFSYCRYLKSFYYDDSLIFKIILVMFLVSIFTFLLYSYKVGSLPIFELLLQTTTSDLQYLRSESTNAFTGKLYRYNLLMKTIPILLLGITFFRRNSTKSWTILYYTLFVYCIFISIIDLQKSILINTLLFLFILYSFELSIKKLKKLFIVFTSIMIVLILLMYLFFLNMINNVSLDLISVPLNRILISQVTPIYWYQVYQDTFGLIHGASFPNPRGMFDFESVRISVVISDFVRPYLITEGIVGSLPTVFFMEWYINFGILMMLFSMFIFGVFIGFVDFIFIKNVILTNHKNILLITLYAYLILYFSNFAITSNVNMIVDTKLIVPVFLIGIFLMFQKILQRGKNA